MKTWIFTSVLSLLAVFAVLPASAQRAPFSNYGVSVNAGTLGLGATGSVVVHKYLNLRAGFAVLPYEYKYTYEHGDMVATNSDGEAELPPIELKAAIKVPAGHLLLDYNPFKQGMGAFHLTAGIYFGGNKLVDVSGQIDYDELVRRDINLDDVTMEIGDAVIKPSPDWKVNAYAKVNGIRPYFGIGWGNAIPKGRVGFRFDLGAVYQGKPKIQSPQMTGDPVSSGDLDTFNKILNKAQFYPQISFALTVRILKDK